MKTDLLLVYFSQILRPLIPIFFIPLFYGVLAKEEFSLITLMSMLLGWIALIDAGMSGSILKYIAVARVSRCGLNNVRLLFLKVLVFLCVAGTISTLLANFIFSSVDVGLNGGLDRKAFLDSIWMISVIFFINLIRGFLTAAVEGFEKHKVISFLGIFFLFGANFVSYLILKDDFFFVGSVGIINYLAVFIFFVFFETVFLFIYVLYLFNAEVLQKNKLDSANHFARDGDYGVVGFLKITLQLSALSIIWIFITNIDKLIISLRMNLFDFSFYQIAFQVCSSVMMLYIPISKVFMPRLMALYSSNEINSYNKSFSKVFYIYAVLTFPSIFLFLKLGEDVLLLWMKDPDAASSIFLFAKWIFPGFYFAALNNFSFLYFNSRMNLNRHLKFYSKYVFCVLPFIVLCAFFGGMENSSILFFIYNFVYFLIWTLRVVIEEYSDVARNVLLFMLSMFFYWIFSEKFLSQYFWMDIFFAATYLGFAFFIFLRISLYEKKKKVCNSCSGI